VRIEAELPLLTGPERSCLERYLDIVVQALGDDLLEVHVYGSVARGESWPAGMPIRSDLDLLVVTATSVPDVVVTQLLDATMPLFLESGRQLGPVFKTPDDLQHPRTERGAEFLRQFRRDAISIYESRATPASRRLRQ
jgi:predicted nucleotidyltransferase